MLYNISLMNEIFSGEHGVPVPTDWDEHYNQTDGALKVDARRKVNFCLEEGVLPVYFDKEIIVGAEAAGLAEDAVIIDIGCSYPYDLNSWQQHSSKAGKLFRQFIGIEPNTQQFNGLRFWQPANIGAPVQEKQKTKRALRWGNLGPALLGVELIKSDANDIPLDDSTVDMAAFNFSFYHIHKHLQRAAIRETKRVLKKLSGSETEVAGMITLSTSGNENKYYMRQNEIVIARMLSLLMGSAVTAPEPLNSGFTTEDAEVLLLQEFKYVYKFEHRGQIVIKNEEEEEILLAAYRTLRDKYTDENGLKPSCEVFEIALQELVGKQLKDARDSDTHVTDLLRQAAFFASDRPLINLPEKFALITALA